MTGKRLEGAGAIPGARTSSTRRVALKPGRERGRQLNVRVSDDEYEAFSAAAKAAGLTLTDWIRLNARIGAGLTRSPRP